MTAARALMLECPVCSTRWPQLDGPMPLVPEHERSGLVPGHERAGAACPGARQRARDIELRHAHFVGIDLGQAQDYSAIAVIERVDVYDVRMKFRAEGTPTDADYRESTFDVRKLERLGLGTAYPSIVRHVEILMRDPRLVKPILIVDKTGVGAPIVDLFREKRLEPVAVTITSGAGTSVIGGAGMGVPKRDLVYALVALFQQGKLRIARRLRFAETLAEELVNFRVEISEAGKDTYEARHGVHDDLLLAVALATWKARRDVEHHLWRPIRKASPYFNVFQI